MTRTRMHLVCVAALAALCCSGAHRKRETLGRAGMEQESRLHELRRRRARYVDVDITVDESAISERDRKTLAYLVKAATVMDRLFWKQVSRDGLAMRRALEGKGGEYYQLLREYIDINFGPYDRLDDYEPFYGSRKAPPGATFYPEDMSRDEFESYLKAHPEQRQAFLSPFTVVVRDKDGNLKAVKYSDYYRKDLEEAAKYLRLAAQSTGDTALKRFLSSRAKAFLDNEYLQSDLDWMDLGVGERGQPSDIDATIGPYEVYEDRLMNLKASFEAFVCLVDKKESKKLEQVSKHLDELEAALPIPPRYKNFSRGKQSPIRVVNVVFTAGDTKAGVQTTAYNLPNDERARARKGSKKVLLKNVGEAKFHKSLIPIAQRVLDPALMPLVNFDAYFNHILMHEVSHGLGPGFIAMPDGSKTTVNVALKETYSTIEECKADVLGIYTTLRLIDMEILPKDFARKVMATALAGIFRSVRFGVTEAHGRANLIQLNYLTDKGAYKYDPSSGRFDVDFDRFPGALRDLAHDLLMIEARGDYGGAKAFMNRYGQEREELKRALELLRGIPVDIRPHYPLADKLLKAEL